MKLIITDLDGTLFDTKDVNYYAYKEAIMEYGYELDYSYYCEFCNGRHYKDFLPQITTTNENILSEIHKKKKSLYKKHLDRAIPNHHLINIISALKPEYKTALVTTASKENCLQILEQFKLLDMFDLILTQDDITKTKPNPEGFLIAMTYFSATPEDTIIFEDSAVGLEAAEKSKCFFYQTYRFN